MITGFGVAEAVRHYYQIWGGNLNGKRAVIQGWGNVGSAAACFLAVEGVKIVGIIDKNGGLINTEGYSLDEVRELFLNRIGNTLVSDDLIPFEEIDEKIWDLESEIFIPAAASRLITKEQSDRMIKAGLEVISCGANVPFADPEIFFGPIGTWTDQQVSVIPDFIANCGMARVFAYLMSQEVEVTDEAIFADVSQTIETALKNTFAENPTKTKLAESSFKIALAQLV
jgi:glutamate dehydrogenase/leucine dehydrogenase